MIDDVVSTGGTLIALINKLKEINVNIEYTVVAVEKGAGKTIVEEKTGTKLISLVKLDVIDGKVVIESVNV